MSETGSLSRRTFLAASGAVASAAVLPGPAAAQVTAAPPPAAGVGYTRLAFGDEFESPGSIYTGTGTPPAGYKWYAQQWFGSPQTPTDNIQISNSVLTLGGGTDTGHQSAAIRTAVRSGSGGFTGSVFGNGAYFEARIAFDPALGAQAHRHWPCFWSMAVEHVYGGTDEQWPGQPAGYTHFAELDFFEAFHAPGESYVGKTTYLGAPHDWSGLYADNKWQYNIQTGNRLYDTNASNWNSFHTYGTLWVPQNGATPGYVRFYFDGWPGPVAYWKAPIGNPPLPGQPSPGGVGEYTPDTPAEAAATYAILDEQRLAVVLGTDYDWPLRCDWVRIWQRP